MIHYLIRRKIGPKIFTLRMAIMNVNATSVENHLLDIKEGAFARSALKKRKIQMNKLLIIATLCLASCASKTDYPTRRIYQPPAIFLPPNSKIQTMNGIYESGPEIEIFHSSQTVEKLERELSRL